MKYTSIIYIDHLEDHLKSWGARAAVKHPNGGEVWVPARPLGYPSFSRRLKAAWLVFTGKADALEWRGQ